MAKMVKKPNQTRGKTRLLKKVLREEIRCIRCFPFSLGGQGLIIRSNSETQELFTEHKVYNRQCRGQIPLIGMWLFARLRTVYQDVAGY